MQVYLAHLVRIVLVMLESQVQQADQVYQVQYPLDVVILVSISVACN